MAEPGLFLSSFAEHFLRARGAEEARSRAAGAEAAEIWQTERYLDELGREREEKDILRRVLATRQGPPTLRPAVSSSLAPPPSPLAAPGLPALPPPGAAGLPGTQGSLAPPASIAGGAAAAVMAPRTPRMSVAESVLAGLDLADQARFLTSRTGRAVMPTLEQSERERRQEDERHEAEDLFTQAQAAFRADPVDTSAGLDLLAAAFRRLGQHGKASQWMQLSAKTRATTVEDDLAAKDAATVLPTLDAYDTDPTAANLAKITEAHAKVKSLAWKKVAAALIEYRLKRALSADRDEEAFLRAGFTSQEKDPAKAWADAAAAHPKGLAKIWQRRIMTGKEELPEELRELLRLRPLMPVKDATLPVRARYLVEQEAAAARAAGAPWTPIQLMHRWENKIRELQAAEHEAKKTPTEKDMEADRAAMLKIRREHMEHPEKMSVNEITLQIQRTNTDLQRGDMSPEEEEDTRGYLTFLRGLREQQRVEGGGVPKGAPADKKEHAQKVIQRLYPGRTWQQLTPKEKERVAGQVP